MTPQEKAKELYDKFKKTLSIGQEMRIEANPFVVECCQNLVDEVLLVINQINDPIQGITTRTGCTPDDKLKYWKEVKQEIEKL